jgi:hypothetical protein
MVKRKTHNADLALENNLQCRGNHRDHGGCSVGKLRLHRRAQGLASV